MKLYDVKCPICGTVNHNLYLEETNGWMECECCQQIVRVQTFAEEQKVPSFKPRQLAAYFAAAN